MTASFYIDDQGEAMLDHPTVLSDRLSTCRGGPDLKRFLIENMGYMHIGLQAGRVKARFCRDTVTEKAISGLLYWAHDAAWTAFCVEHPDDCAVAPLIRSTRELVSYLYSCGSRSEIQVPFKRRSIALARSPFEMQADAGIEIARSVAQFEVRHHLLDRLFQGRYSLMSIDREVGDFRIEHLGTGYAMFGGDFRDAMTGRLVRETPDEQFANWSADVFAEYRMRSVSGVEEVDAAVTWPGRPPMRYRYKRLLAPVGLSDGSQKLLCAAFPISAAQIS